MSAGEVQVASVTREFGDTSSLAYEGAEYRMLPLTAASASSRSH